MMWSVDTDRRTSGDMLVFGCAECPRVSSVSARGWKAYRVAEPDEGGQPELPARLPRLRPQGVRRPLKLDPSIEAALPYPIGQRGVT